MHDHGECGDRPGAVAQTHPDTLSGPRAARGDQTGAIADDVASTGSRCPNPGDGHHSRPSGHYQTPWYLRGATVHRVVGRSCNASGGLPTNEYWTLWSVANTLRAFHVANSAVP